MDKGLYVENNCFSASQGISRIFFATPISSPFYNSLPTASTLGQALLSYFSNIHFNIIPVYP
jgi:hypothetical protein